VPLPSRDVRQSPNLAPVVLCYDDQIKPQDAEAFAATARACESVGWEFRRVGAMDPVRTANLRWLAGYRHPRCMNADHAVRLRYCQPFITCCGRMSSKLTWTPLPCLPRLW
jgi:hypothetical protein